jgi:AraC-like DNA-binding protein
MWEISIIGVSQIAFGIILMMAKRKVKSDYILIGWLILLSLPFIELILTLSNTSWPIFTKLNNQSYTLLHGPFLYLYLKEITKKEDESIKWWPHFIVFAIFFVLFIFNTTPLHPGGPLESIDTGFSILRHFGAINIVVFLIYGIVSFKSLYTHRLKIKEIFAYKNGEITLVWLLLIPVLFIFFVILILIIENSYLQNIIQIEAMHLLLFLFFALYLIFFGLRQGQVYPNESKKDLKIDDDSESLKEENEPAVKVMQDDDSEIHKQLLNKMENIMREEKIYLNPTLSVYDLADAIKVSRHQISSLLNNDLSLNFYQYVNKYRLEEFCKRIEDDADNRFNIIEHAYDSGFNSKSSFNSLFKTNYEMTPSQYRKSLKRPN